MGFDLIILLAAPVIIGISYWLAKRTASGSSSPEISFENAILAIRVPKENEKDALASEQMFSSLHGLLRLTPGIQEHITFEIAASNSGINFYAACPRALRPFVESQIYAQYPAAEIKEIPDYASRSTAFFDRSVEGTVLKLARPEYFPIRTFREFEVDPLAAITSAVSQLKENEEIWIQILLRPVPDVWQGAGHNYVSAVRTGTKPVEFSVKTITQTLLGELSHLPAHMAEGVAHPARKHATEYRPPMRKEKPDISKGVEEELKAIEFKLAKMGFQCLIRLVAVAPTPEEAFSHLRSVTASFRQFSTANLNSFVPGQAITDKMEFLESYRRRSLSEEDPYILGTEELASIFHLPSISVETPLIDWSPAKTGEPPLNLPTKDCTYIGRTTFRDSMARFGLKRDDRTTHFYAVGKTGAGKTTLFKNMIVQDIRNGEGVGVIDPHGDLIEELLNFIPKDRVEDVILFDPGDTEHPVALNVLECPDQTQKNLMASGIVGSIKNHFENSWGPRLEYLLNNAVLTLLEVPSTTMLGITRILEDKNYQKYITYKIKDPVIKDFWENEFKQMMGNVAFHTEAIAPIQNKIGRFLASSTIRNILGQARSTLKIDDVMNNRKILFCNLAKGKIGADNANLLGSLLVSRINFMAMQRVKIPMEDRKDFYLYVDEFQNFASGTFGSILSEARKYRLSLHMTHQYTAQLPEEVQDAVFGNVGTMVVFGVGAPDAHVLGPEFAPYFEENDLISLERHHAYVKMMINGMTEAPFSAVTDPPPSDPANLREEVINRSWAKYSTDSSVVESRVKRWLERQFDLGMAIAEETKAKLEAEGTAAVTSDGSGGTNNVSEVGDEQGSVEVKWAKEPPPVSVDKAVQEAATTKEDKEEEILSEQAPIIAPVIPVAKEPSAVNPRRHEPSFLTNERELPDVPLPPYKRFNPLSSERGVEVKSNNRGVTPSILTQPVIPVETGIYKNGSSHIDPRMREDDKARMTNIIDSGKSASKPTPRYTHSRHGVIIESKNKKEGGDQK